MTACTELQLAAPDDGVAREGQKGMPRHTALPVRYLAFVNR
jgi:hypothetical protein